MQKFKLKVILFSIILICCTSMSFATLEHFTKVPEERRGQIVASSFFNDNFILISRVSISDGPATKKTLNGNSFGSEFDPQVGTNINGGTETSYSWEITNQSPCTLNVDGSRSIKRDIVCIEYNQVSKQSAVVQTSKCVAAQRPKDEVYCLSPDEVYQWNVLNVSSCTSKCGTGTVQRSRACINTNLITEVRKTVQENECEMFGLPTPSLVSPCTELTGCAKGWSYSGWSTCQGTCGASGIQSREAKCIDNAGTELAASECESISGAAITTKECTPECAKVWGYSVWGVCQGLCGATGTQIREAQCFDTDGIQYENSACEASLGSAITTQECAPECVKEWRYSDWGPCQGACGSTGTQTREAQCVDGSGREFSAGECEYALGSALTTQTCTPECSTWVYGEWSQCSGQCFQAGSRTREASCEKASGVVVADEFCPGVRELLPTSEPCVTACSGTSCSDLLAQYPGLPDGSYTIAGSNGNFSATCDMTGGGWTLVPTLAGLSNFDGITQLKGYTEEQANRLYTLVAGGMSGWVGYTHTWNPGQLNGANPSTSFNLSVADIVTFSKNNNILMPISSRVNGWTWADDNDTGRMYLSLYNSAGTNIYNYDSGYNNWSSGWTAWYNFYYTGSPVPDALSSDLGSIKYYFFCSRKSGTACSAAIVAYTYFNNDLPKANLWVK